MAKQELVRSLVFIMEDSDGALILPWVDVGPNYQGHEGHVFLIKILLVGGVVLDVDV